jgi:hypothetical protein
MLPPPAKGRGATTGTLMPKVRLGRTDRLVSPICFGTSGLGDMPATFCDNVSVERAAATVRGVTKPERASETLDWARLPVPAAFWQEAASLPIAADGPEATCVPRKRRANDRRAPRSLGSTKNGGRVVRSHVRASAKENRGRAQALPRRRDWSQLYRTAAILGSSMLVLSYQ